MNYYVTYCDEEYLETAENLIDSFLKCSNYKLIFYTLNFSYKHSNDRIICKKLDIDNKSSLTKKASFTLLKPFILQASLDDFGDNNYCFIDADNIFLLNSDNIFNFCDETKPYPICGRNCHDYMVQFKEGVEYGNVFQDGEKDLTKCLEYDLLNLLKIDINKRSDVYRQTNVILYTNNCRSFFDKWGKICFSKPIIENQERYVLFYDEPIYNALLWEAGIDYNIGLISINIPLYDCDIDIFEFIDKFNNPKDKPESLGPFCRIPAQENMGDILFLHGGKLSKKQYRIIDQEILPKHSLTFDIKSNKNQKVEISPYKKGKTTLKVYGVTEGGVEKVLFDSFDIKNRETIFFANYYILNFYKKILIELAVEKHIERKILNINAEYDFSQYPEKDLEILRSSPYFVFNEVFCERYYDTPKVWKNKETCIDIGSNAGFFALKANTKGFKKITCIEPDKRLKKFNDILNKKYNNIGYIDKAFYNKSGEKINLFLTTTKDSGGQTIFEEYKPEIVNGKIECETINLKDILHNDIVDLLKIDCEGAEIFIFDDDNLKLIKNNVKYLTAEMHLNKDVNIKSFQKKLKENNFECFYKFTGSYQTNLFHLYAINKSFFNLNKIVYLAPHYSTGGMPEYLFNKVKDDLTKGMDVYIIECSYAGEGHAVQRNKVKEIIGNKFIQTNNDSEKILKAIKDIDPDILHIQEEPELFDNKNDDFWHEIFSKERNYFIKITSHTSTFTPNKKWLPDEYVFCCKKHFDTYKDINISKSLCEQQISKQDKNPAAFDILNVDKSKKHVVQVGLFNDNKNQKYTIEIAKKLSNEDIVFHFVGNMAPNFKEYWQDIDKPENCIFWGERDDVNLFYSIADLFILPSKEELNPISLKEARSFDLKCLVSNYPVIKDNLPDFSGVDFLTNDLEEDTVKTKNLLFCGQSKKRVFIKIDSDALGDTIAWIPYVDEYRKVNDCRVYCYTVHKDLFEKVYSNITFIDNENDISYDKKITLGLCLNDKHVHKNDYQSIPLQQIASDLLDLEYKEIKPKIYIKEKARKIKEKYICIATQSTCKAKLWQPKEWEKLIKFLKKQGYKVVCIDKHQYFGVEGDMNGIPENCMDKTGDHDLQDRITDIYNCEFFIGLSSGLSWLAWALDKPVVMISGFTDPKNEFYTPYRIINRNVCNSCWNDKDCVFDRNDWHWCPRNKNFECSRSITFEMVKNKMKPLLFF